MNNNDRVNLIKRITEIEGLTDNERSALLGLLRENKTYGLVWENKPEDIEERLRDELPILTEVPERAIISEDKDAPNHILIEGDNLEALTTLAYTHAGKIDVIYIDPPYNTGNKDFIYNDSFVDTEDSYRHSKWLTFMAKRLRIAKQLLSDNGAIFISIDDNEQAQLKLLCDEIFAGFVFLGNIIWEKTDSPRMDVKSFSVRHDYILVYSKQSFTLKREPLDEIPKHYNRTDDKGNLYYTKPLRLMGGHLNDNLFYELIAPDGSSIFPYEKNGDKGGWRWSKKKYLDEIERIEWVNGRNGWVPYFRIYAENRKQMPVQTLWNFDKVGSTRTAKSEMTQIINSNLFNYPKPTKLISYIEQISSDKESIILDFFAGSGTTLHATMQLNAKDQGHRQCILVTNNENNICEEVTYVRNKKVIEGYTTPKGEEVPGLTNNNLRYYRTGFVGRSRTMQNMRKLVNLATDMLCIKENLYTEQTKFGEQKTFKSVFRYFNDGKKQMLVIYREEAIDELVDIIYQLEFDTPLKVYVFSPSEDPWEGSFEDVLDKVELCALPQAIYNTYRRILPKKKDTLINPEEDVLDQGDETEESDGMLHFVEEGEEA